MNIPTWSLPSRITCPNATESCKKYCYAKKAEKVWPNVIKSRKCNLADSKRDGFVEAMSYKIKSLNVEYFRIHESGDFYLQKYLDKWFKICKKNPNTTFLVYTQNYYLDFSDKPDNLVIYFSIWSDSKHIPDSKFPKAYVIGDKLSDYDKDIKGFTCKKEEKDITCEQCLYCFKGKGNVIFHLH